MQFDRGIPRASDPHNSSAGISYDVDVYPHMHRRVMLMLERSPDSDLGKLPTTSRARSEPPGGKRYLCAACREIVAFAEHRVIVEGRNEHRFSNPSGIVYEIICFSAARGCAGIGTPTTEFTWFKPYAWQIGYCRSCDIHLGWRFSGGPRPFYGLIRARLIGAQ